MIYLHGTSQTPPNGSWKYTEFTPFIEWVKDKRVLQFDTETNVCDSIVERELMLVQVSDVYGKDVWLFQWWGLNQAKRDFIGKLVQDPHILKLIQNASFEYQIFRKQGYFLDNVWDTMLAEKVLYTGHKTLPGFHGLKGILERRWGLDLSKAEQTLFGDGQLDDDRIRYAALDVKYLGGLMIEQTHDLKREGLENVTALEFATVLAIAEMEYTGMALDTDAWRENIALAQPIIDEAKGELDAFLRGEEFREAAIREGFLTDEDSLLVPWNSPKTRQELLQLLFPDLPGATKPVVEKFLKDRATPFQEVVLREYLNKEYTLLNQYLSYSQGPLLEERGYFTPKDTCLINWGSPPQRLKMFQVVEPKLKATAKEDLADCEHPIIEAYQEWVNTTKLTTSFGEKFIQEQVDPDGRVRTRHNQIINTGRVSSSQPNLQNIPAKENVGNRYRNCFVEEPGWVFVDSDFASQELVMIAYFSKDPVWAEALNQNQDLHSVCAEQVFGKKWEEAQEEGCAYYTKGKEKCKCKKHKTLRTLVKTINFGLAYGMSKYKLSATAKVSLEEAQQTITDYFKAFPGISKTLDQFGAFGRKRGYIVTPPPFNRKRYYENWHPRLEEWELARIERASKNMPIQGGAADVTKTALVLVYNKMKEGNLWDKVRLVACVHDQITTTCKEEFAPVWKDILHNCMLEAAKVVVTNGQLGAETMITEKWSK